jgi:hypothetical protein
VEAFEGTNWLSMKFCVSTGASICSWVEGYCSGVDAVAVDAAGTRCCAVACSRREPVLLVLVGADILFNRKDNLGADGRAAANTKEFLVSTRRVAMGVTMCFDL